MKHLLLLLACIGTLHTSAQLRYVFYLHGAIVEGTTTDPISESFGRYEYSKIVKTLKQYGYVVFSEARPAGTVPEGYALKIAAEIDSLKKKGVKSKYITVIGASKGAGIAMLVSGLVKDKQVKYVLMAGCSNKPATPYNLYGQVLSIYEKSDAFAGSCKNIRKASAGVTQFKEIELNTGKKHGFIFTPLNEWVQPAVEWIGQ